MPETWVPTSTSVTGSTVPVAITELRIVMRLVAAVCSVMSSVRGERSQSHAPQTTATAARRRKKRLFPFHVHGLIVRFVNIRRWYPVPGRC